MKPVPAEGEVVEEIECPGSAVGSIIGKGGAEIKSIQEKSGARIVIPRDSTICWIVGTKPAVAAASKLVKAKIQVRLTPFFLLTLALAQTHAHTHTRECADTRTHTHAPHPHYHDHLHHHRYHHPFLPTTHTLTHSLTCTDSRTTHTGCYRRRP
jgi:hypothetical protein